MDVELLGLLLPVERWKWSPFHLGCIPFRNARMSRLSTNTALPLGPAAVLSRPVLSCPALPRPWITGSRAFI